jgi:hypothetical protein
MPPRGENLGKYVPALEENNRWEDSREGDVSAEEARLADHEPISHLVLL